MRLRISERLDWVGPKILLQSEAKSEATDIKLFCYILMQMKLIFARKVLHLASFWKWGFLELGEWPIDTQVKVSVTRAGHFPAG